MIEIRMLDTNKTRVVTANVAIDLVGRGMATRDLHVKKPVKAKSTKGLKKPPGYEHRQMNPSSNIHIRKSF